MNVPPVPTPETIHVDCARGVAPRSPRPSSCGEPRGWRVGELPRHHRAGISKQLLRPCHRALHALLARGQVQVRRRETPASCAAQSTSNPASSGSRDSRAPRHECQRDTGIARRRLDQVAPGLNLPCCSKARNHVHADAILHARERLKNSSLSKTSALMPSAAHGRRTRNQRRVAHRFDDAVVDAPAPRLIKAKGRKFTIVVHDVTRVFARR